MFLSLVDLTGNAALSMFLFILSRIEQILQMIALNICVICVICENFYSLNKEEYFPQMAQIFTDDCVRICVICIICESLYSSIVLKVRFTLGVFTLVVGGSL